MVIYFFVNSTMRYKSSGKILRDVHKLVNNDANFVVGTQLVKMLGKDFYHIVGLLTKGNLPYAREAPNARPSPA